MAGLMAREDYLKSPVYEVDISNRPFRWHEPELVPDMEIIRQLRASGMTDYFIVPLPFQDGSFDRVFTGHFYGHLRAGERERFVAEALRVAGQLVVVDSHVRPDHDAEEEQERTLNDGSVHTVYKRYFSGAGLAAELGGGEVLHDGDWFVMVRVSAPTSAPSA